MARGGGRVGWRRSTNTSLGAFQCVGCIKGGAHQQFASRRASTWQRFGKAKPAAARPDIRSETCKLPLARSPRSFVSRGACVRKNPGSPPCLHHARSLVSIMHSTSDIRPLVQKHPSSDTDIASQTSACKLSSSSTTTTSVSSSSKSRFDFAVFSCVLAFVHAAATACNCVGRSLNFGFARPPNLLGQLLSL